MPLFYVYILKCADGSYYTGHTDDLNKRLWEHENGKYEGYTSIRRPVKLVYSEGFHRRIDALTAEMKIKTWGRRKKDALVNGGWQGIIALRKKKNAKAC
jgi:tRNA/rRNA methyltransferase